jgi:hypothetical protein
MRPSILPFVVDLVNRIQARSKGHTHSPDPAVMTTDTPVEPIPTVCDPSDSLTQVRMTLRIDRSELRFSCNPDSDAYADVKWESGGLLASTTLGKQDISTLACTISGVTATLSHEFADQGRSCIEAGAKDMAFSLALCNGYGDGHTGDTTRRGVSIVLDTQIAAAFRLEAFSAWLIFTSVWIDNAPALDIQPHAVVPETTNPVSVPLAVSSSRQKLAIAALIRIKSIEFDTNIAVSKAKLSISPLVLRTLSNGERTEVDLKIGTIQVVSAGDISGTITSDSMSFNTVRRSSRATHASDPTVLSMAITAGDLSGLLFVGETNVVRFLYVRLASVSGSKLTRSRLEPAQVTLKDDWRMMTDQTSAEVTLAFIVHTGKFHGVLRLLVIPRLVLNLHSIFDMVESQTRIATQRSESFKTSEAKRNTDPSPLATVIMSKAKIPGVGTAIIAPNTSDVRTAQTMRFDLGGLDLGIFNENKEGKQDAEFSRFVIGEAQAILHRDYTVDGRPKRELELKVASIRWDTSDGASVTTKEEKVSTAMDLIKRSAVNKVNVLYMPSVVCLPTYDRSLGVAR